MTTPATPIVSILMTAYNRETLLAEAIESVLASTLQDFELIVVDDGSTDRSFEIAQSYAASDARIRAFRNERNLGDYLNRNRAARFARGTYLKYLDSDDLIYPWGLGAMVACMKRFPEAGLGLSAVADPHRPHPTLLSPREAYLEHFTRRDLLGRAPGSAIIRREAFETLGGFTGLRQVGDFEFWLMMVARYPLVTMPRDLVWDRTHGQQEQFADDDIEKLGMRHRLAVAALQGEQCPLTEEERTRARMSMTRAYRKGFWLRLLVQRQPSAAFRLRRAVGLPFAKLAT
jgi:glycosyltransferase involved in cell wall biosynthesis